MFCCTFVIFFYFAQVNWNHGEFEVTSESRSIPERLFKILLLRSYPLIDLFCELTFLIVIDIERRLRLINGMEGKKEFHL